MPVKSLVGLIVSCGHSRLFAIGTPILPQNQPAPKLILHSRQTFRNFGRVQPFLNIRKIEPFVVCRANCATVIVCPASSSPPMFESSSRSLKSQASTTKSLVVTLCTFSCLCSVSGQVGGIPELQRYLNDTVKLAPVKPEAEPARPGFFYANPGPWGKLKCFYIYIEAPQAMVDEFPLPFSKPRWTFKLEDSASLPALFEKAGLPDFMRSSLLEPLNTTKGNGLLHIFPSLTDLEAMTPAMREVIYPVLAKNPSNDYHADPVLITTDTVEEWYRSSKLRPELVAKIKQMSYHRGEAWAFSDLGALMNYANSDSEARSIFKAFTRTRSQWCRWTWRK